ncbi:uncharacterized protein LOC129300976 [Prosopis cineraria]|uniref:uncharacterized protein LOC129295675 n=1 Tax=Prosopis cineraria TaxID=364024 RepID=UPI00240EB4F0|nr:uncharacterized protein LOC129295675 [Prosopis cineraria]XP_054795542.1 uncharacterized protein LOC129300976 [Prosopis cineraria]
MGNAASCTPSLMISNGGIKVLSLDGRLESYTRAVKAAELMLENPGQFVCDSGFLKVGHRIQGLLADEELERKKFYFLLPMELLYSVLTHEEISSMNYKASRAVKHGGFNNLGKIFPVCMFPSEAKRLEGHDDDTVGCEGEKIEKRCFSKQGSWRPALETIDEIP